MTELYNQVEEGAFADLASAQSELDRAVAIAYGWPASVVGDPEDSNQRLLELNAAIANRQIENRGPVAVS